jgi:hypothetical protein
VVHRRSQEGKRRKGSKERKGRKEGKDRKGKKGKKEGKGGWRSYFLSSSHLNSDFHGILDGVRTSSSPVDLVEVP